MIPKNLRISRRLFGSIMESGRVFHSPHFSLRLAPADSARVAVSVSKKVSKSAVARNRSRRRAYAAIAPLVFALPPKLYLFSAKSGADRLNAQELKSELAALLKKS